jgi:enoyl-CoA hydratase/carnithine racemase
MLTGDLLDAHECKRIGLVNEVYPPDGFKAGIDALVSKIEAKSPAGVRGAKFLLNTAIREDLETGLRSEMDYVENYATTEKDPMEGLRAFKEKRKPKFGK